MNNCNIRSMFATLAMLAIWAASPQARAAADHQSGNINNITSTPSGLMIMLDSGPPTNCAGTLYGWMLIPESNKTMIATTLAMWLSGRTAVTIYVAPFTGGFCTINQVDPY